MYVVWLFNSWWLHNLMKSSITDYECYIYLEKREICLDWRIWEEALMGKVAPESGLKI